MDKKMMIEALNRALAQEYACHIRYLTHAALVTGPYAEPLGARLKEIGEDEGKHAGILRDRITALGGTPTMEVGRTERARDLARILTVNIKEERAAIRIYLEILKQIPHDEEILLFEAIEAILKDEQEHLEELQRLQG